MPSVIEYRPWQISAVDFGLSVMVNFDHGRCQADISGGFWPLGYGKYQPKWQVFPRLSAIAAPQNSRYGGYQWQILASLLW
ncbi:hypothetical protein QL285_088501 [Trifolium repens]|jgi:hypothetical protein|nr:hypothetical protein QL285_088501 [Trifolium repens]